MWLFALFVAVPLIEIALFIQLGGLIGLWPTLMIVVVTAVIGTSLVRNQGALAMSQLRGSINRLSDPTEPLAHGAMILIAGALLLTPGFFTDSVGFALLVPPVRRAAFSYLKKRVTVQSFEYGGAGPRPTHDPRGPGRAQTGRPDVIEGEYTEMDPAKRPTHGSSGWTRH